MKKYFIGFVIFSLVSCASLSNKNAQSKIYLYGESHGNPICYEEEFEIWSYLYKQGARDLFVEFSYSGGKLLNEWMKAKDDTILNFIFESLQGTQADNQYHYNFLKQIKKACPKTKFYGIDVEHQPNSIGEHYLSMLSERGLKESSEYTLVVENIADGNDWNTKKQIAQGWENREKVMVKNFTREYDALPSGTTVFGIFGSLHTGMQHHIPEVKTLAASLIDYYTPKGVLLNPALGFETINIAGKSYKTEYFGKILRGGANGIESLAFYRLVDTTDFADLPYLGDNLPEGNYPVPLQTGDCFCVVINFVAGESLKHVYRCDGNTMSGMLNSHLVFNE